MEEILGDVQYMKAIVSKQTNEINAIKSLSKGYEAIKEQSSTYMKVILSHVHNMKATVLKQTNEINALKILSEGYETTVLKQTNEINALKIRSEGHETTVLKQTNEINALKILAEGYETTVLKQTNEINAFKILSEGYETTIPKQANEIKDLNIGYNDIITRFNSAGISQQVSPYIWKQSGWEQHGKSMYKRFSVEFSWMNAMQMCKLSSASQGYLAEIYSSSDKYFVNRMMGSGEYWLGGCQSQDDDRAVWRWCGTNQVMGSYRPWAQGEPNNILNKYTSEENEAHFINDENCLQSWKGGEWNDKCCDHVLPFVCEIPI